MPMARIYALKAGTSLPDEIIRIAKKERIKTARVEAIGGVNRLRLAYLTTRRRSTRNTSSTSSLR